MTVFKRCRAALSCLFSPDFERVLEVEANLLRTQLFEAEQVRIRAQAYERALADQLQRTATLQAAYKVHLGQLRVIDGKDCPPVRRDLQ